MEISVLISLLGLGLVFGLGGSDDDASEDASDRPDATGAELRFVGSPTITGTAGNDVLGPAIEEPFGPFDVDLIDMGDGDDLVVNFGDFVGATVNGGGGLPEAVLTGGAGADAFEIALNLWPDLDTLEDGDTTFQVDLGILITDFEPGDYALIIEL